MKKLKCILESVLYLIIIFLVWEIVYVLYSYGVNNLADGKYHFLLLIENAEYIYILFGWLIGISIIIFILKRVEKKDLYNERRRLRLSNMIMSVIIGFGIIFIVNGIISLFNEYYSLNSFFMNSNQSFSLVQSILIAGILLPVFEEILFRGLILSKLREQLSTISAVIIQAVFFAISHFSLFQGGYAFILGLLIGISVIKTKTIKSGIIIHITFNVGNLFLSETYAHSYHIKELMVFFILGVMLVFFGIDKLQKDKIVFKN